MTYAGSGRRHFTEAARAAAVIARQAKRESKGPIDAPEVFVVRAAETPGSFGWELRRFGGVVLTRSVTTLPTAAEALAAGRQALGRMAEAGGD